MQEEGLQLMQRLKCESLECMQRVPWPQLVALDSCCHLYCYAAVCATLIAASAVAHAAVCLTLVAACAVPHAAAAAFVSGNTLLSVLRSPSIILQAGVAIAISCGAGCGYLNGRAVQMQVAQPTGKAAPFGHLKGWCSALASKPVIDQVFAPITVC